MGKFFASLVRLRYRLIIYVSLAILCINCIDPYVPDIENYESLLVVDALLTDEDAASYVKLSRSSQIQGAYEAVRNATVVISDDSGGIDTLIEVNSGEYWTNPSTFRGEVGKSYTLSIVTPEGEEYLSAPCLMYPVTEMDSLYYTYHEAIPEGFSDPYAGVNIYASTPSESASGYRRWTYDEWWKFRVPYPVIAEFVDDDLILDIETQNEICWSHNLSKNINLHPESPDDGTTLHQSVLFLPTELSSRFQIQYYIEVKQLSISRDEYEFWNNMKLLNDTGGDIFDKQPFSVVGNMKNVNHPSKNALGYFQVSSVSTKQIYITNNDIRDLGLTRYRYDCEKITITLDDFPFDVSWSYVYSWALREGYSFYAYETSFGNLIGLMFARPFCTDCTLNGELEEPDFWVDL